MPIQSGVVVNQTGEVWVQPYGCGTDVQLLPCSMIEDDIEIQIVGDTEDKYCLDKGKRVRVATLVSPPDNGEINITTYLAEAANWLDLQISRGTCDFPLYITYHCPVKGLFNNWSHILKIENAVIVAHAITNNPVDMRGNDTATEVYRQYTIRYSPTDAVLLHEPSPILKDSGVTTDLADVGYLQDETNCVGDCVDERLACSTGYTAGNGDGVTNGSPLVGVDTNCQNWAQIGAWFIGAATDNISALIASDIGTEPRIVMLSEPTAGTIFYADGYEPTAATSVVIAGVTGSGPTASPNAMTQRADGSIWFVTDDGEIVYSEDNALTWEIAKDASDATALNAIHFIDDQNGLAGGASGNLWFSQNSGLSWIEADPANTGISANIVSVKASDDDWYILTTTGLLYRKPLGSNPDEAWTAQLSPVTTSATATDMDIKGCNIVVVWDNASGTNVGRVSYSVNGGANWSNPNKTGQVVSNTGFNAVYLRKDLEATIVGDGGVVVELSGLPQL